MKSEVINLPQAEVRPQQSKGCTEMAAFLKRFDRPGPRYTSYPTIDQCAEAAGPDTYVEALQARALGGLQRPLSLYLHIPFCSSVCYYCACNKVITRKRDQVQGYIQALLAEAEWVIAQSKALTPVIQFHLGGGTPTFLSDAELLGLLRELESRFEFSPYCERSIEVDPRTVDGQRLNNLRHMGFNRISFGVQDFDSAVQKAVHREQDASQVGRLIEAARQLEFQSINVDLIYGLPLQTEASFKKTLETLVRFSPDRVALYGYAHLPERFKPQRRIHVAELPTAAQRVAILELAIQSMREAGYEYIGMDHFAKPGDSLAKAKRQGLLHRNFQGYTTQPDADLIGLGVSAISKVGPALVQNTRDLEEYLYAVNTAGSAVFRGHVSDRDDLIRHSVIMSILCQGEIEFSNFKQTHWVEFEQYFQNEMSDLHDLAEAGLLDLTEDKLSVTEKGWFFVRPIAMVFDSYSHKPRTLQSKVL